MFRKKLNSSDPGLRNRMPLPPAPLTMG